FRKAKMSVKEGMKYLHEAGLDSLPGGGAEIFHPDIRSKICNDKVDAEGWLAIHEAAHELGMPSNATILYGHIESYWHRIDHMERLRQMQDRTGGDRKSTRLNSSHVKISYAVFCLKKNKRE